MMVDTSLHQLTNMLTPLAVNLNQGKGVFSILEYYKSAVFIPHVLFGANQPLH